MKPRAQSSTFLFVTRVILGTALLLTVMLGVWYAFQRTPAPVPPPRSLILISIDTLRADHLGVYGYEHDTSPKLSRRLAFHRTEVRVALIVDLSKTHCMVRRHAKITTGRG